MTSTTRARIRDYPPARSDLIAKAMDKPIKLFRQYDVFPRVGFDLNPPYNEQGDQHWGGDAVWELRNGTPVRVQIELNVSAEDVVRALRDIANQIEQHGFGDYEAAEEPPF